MSLYKRGNTWWVRFTAPNGERIRRSAGTENKQLAQEYHDQLKVDLWRIHRLGEKPRRTWQEAIVRWVKDTDSKADHQKDLAKLRWFDQFLRNRSRLDRPHRRFEKARSQRLYGKSLSGITARDPAHGS